MINLVPCKDFLISAFKTLDSNKLSFIFENNEVAPSNTVLLGFTPINLVASTPPNLELNPVA